MPEITQVKVKPFYTIKVKVKTKYKTYLSDFCDMSQNFIHFQGNEMEEDQEPPASLDEAEAILGNGNKVERYYPWTSVVNIDLKRLLKKQ